MGRQRSPDRDKAFEIYKKHKGNIDLVEIAKQLNLSDGTVRGWKNKDKWEEHLNGTFQKKEIKKTERSKSKKNTINKESELTAVTELQNSELTDKQRLFCSYYVKYRNKTKAYMKAYQCSWENANAHAYEMWDNVGIRKEIDRHLKQIRDELKLDAQDIAQKYIDIAFSDINDFLEFGIKEAEVPDNKTGGVKKILFNYVDFKNSYEIDGTLISEVKQGKDGVSLKLYDKMKALDWLANHLDLLDTATREKLDIEKQKVQIAREKLELDKQKVNKDPKLEKPIEIIIKRKGEGNADSEGS